MKKKIKMKYPSIGIQMSQNPTKFEVCVLVAESVQFSVFIDKHNLEWIKKEIEIILDNP